MLCFCVGCQLITAPPSWPPSFGLFLFFRLFLEFCFGTVSKNQRLNPIFKYFLFLQVLPQEFFWGSFGKVKWVTAKKSGCPKEICLKEQDFFLYRRLFWATTEHARKKKEALELLLKSDINFTAMEKLWLKDNMLILNRAQCLSDREFFKFLQVLRYSKTHETTSPSATYGFLFNKDFDASLTKHMLRSLPMTFKTWCEHKNYPKDASPKPRCQFEANDFISSPPEKDKLP